jgi:hypothetical protein
LLPCHHHITHRSSHLPLCGVWTCARHTSRVTAPPQARTRVSHVKSGGGESGGVCVCACRCGGDDPARSEMMSAVIVRALPFLLPSGRLAVRGVIGLDPSANTWEGWWDIESCDCCNASRCGSITGAAGVTNPRVHMVMWGSGLTRSREREESGHHQTETEPW